MVSVYSVPHTYGILLSFCTHGTGAAILPNSEIVSGSGPIFLDQLECSDTDSYLLGCRRLRPLGLHTCDHSRDVGVACTGEKFLLRLQR